MSLRREALVEQRLLALIEEHGGRLDDPDSGGLAGSSMSATRALKIFEAALHSRLLDLEARRLKDAGLGYYTIASSGHEANAVFGHQLRASDPAFLHYRSGAFLIARAAQVPGQTPLFDILLSLTASAEDPISGGRHKVLGSVDLNIPPQTSTIASHLPKAVGYAFALGRIRRGHGSSVSPLDSVVYCSFGDASTNHATALAGFNAAAAARLHHQPCPILFVCEDNGLGISVRTPRDFIERQFRNREGLAYFRADGRDLAQTYAIAAEAIDYCRRSSRPVFFHLLTTRLMGHAGTDLETSYMSKADIEANEQADPLLQWADLLIRTGAIDKDQLLAMYHDAAARITRGGAEAATRRRLSSSAEVTAPLQFPEPTKLRSRVATRERRLEVFRGKLPEEDNRPRHLAFRLAQALKDLLAAYPEIFLFGEDVAKKGGVYHVTDGLHEAFGGGRVFNTILDETTILGLAQGLGCAGCLPFPEIQYLAYVHNALDQIRGEAASLQFFSKGQFRNPMVVRIAGFAYQRGFGGHFHNDDSIGALMDIPGLIIAAPSRADDAVEMLRTCAAAAATRGSVCLFLEPIALYMTKDLHAAGDGLWQFPYPAPDRLALLGEPRVYGATEDDHLTIVSYANGLHMSLQAQRILAEQGLRARVVDLRWIAPLPIDAVRAHALATGHCLIVDECRRTMGGPSVMLLTELCQAPDLSGVRLRRLAADDSFVPLGPAANEVLVQLEDIVTAARELCPKSVS